MASIWSAAAGTPTGTHRVPVDTGAAGSPTMYTVQQLADLETSVGVSVNALGSIAVNTAIDLALGGYVSATIGANLTLSFTNPPAGGTEFTLVLTNGGAFTVTWPGSVTWAGATAPTLTASGTDVLHFTSGNGGTNWYGWLEADLALGTTAGTAAEGNDSRLSDDRTASGLRSATTVVSVSAATAPSSGQVLTATASTTATWQTPSGGGTPGGSDTQVQFNDGGAFGGDAGLTYNKTTDTLTVAQDLNVGDDLAVTGDAYLGNSSIWVRNNALELNQTSLLSFSGASNPGLTKDVVLVREAAGVLAHRATTTAQTARIYGTYTDASNYVRASLAATSTAVTLAAETAGTGADNVPVILTPAGTSQVEVGNGVQFTEMTAPSAPAANKVILFAQDNGAGKTQLMALFPSGAAQQVAIEP